MQNKETAVVPFEKIDAFFLRLRIGEHRILVSQNSSSQFEQPFIYCAQLFTD
uniref:Uncharacterized protein n=1 Tax=Setaria italica TaxID=4555 RepID=K3Z1F9_SETIT